MLNKTLYLLLLTFCGIAVCAADYPNPELGPDHFPQKGVPGGKLEGPIEFRSKIISGTVRRYWVYVPAQYKKSKPASLLVFQDGQRATNPEGSLRVPQVLDNLIAKNDIPITIGLFVTPGNLTEHYPKNLGTDNPDHRAQEYDAMNDRYVSMLIEELIPIIEKQYTLTKDPEQRVIGGTSSGAIAAFTAAWQRPDYFRKVFSGIGSYVSIGFRPEETPIKLGGQDYPALIRREAIKPIAVYFQDGSNDLDNEWGDWFLANQQMVKALAYANRNADNKNLKGSRYRFTHIWTNGEHNDRHPGAVLPDALRWLMK